MNQQQTTYAEGDQVKVLATSECGEPEMDSGAGRVGDTYRVFAYVGGKDGDDPKGKDYLLLDGPGAVGGERWSYPEHVEMVRTAAEMAARKPPTAAAIGLAVGRQVIDLSREDFTFHETDYSTMIEHGGTRFVQAVGTTAEGLEFSCEIVIKVRNIEIEDQF